MTTPYPHTTERIRLPNPNGPSATEHTEDLIDILREFAKTGTLEDIQDQWWEFRSSVWKPYGYGPAGESNSVWGRQERLLDQPPSGTDKDGLINALKSVGFIIQDEDPYPDTDGVHVFVPSIHRYFPYNNAWSPLEPVDVAIFDYRNSYQESHGIGIAGPQPVLQKIAPELPLDKNRAMFGHLYPDLRVDDITGFLQSKDLCYRVYGSYTGRGPYREWFADASSNQVVFQDSLRNQSEYAAHSWSEEGEEAACGAFLFPEDYQDAHVVSEETATQYFNVSPCNHPACR